MILLTCAMLVVVLYPYTVHCTTVIAKSLHASASLGDHSKADHIFAIIVAKWLRPSRSYALQPK